MVACPPQVMRLTLLASRCSWRFHARNDVGPDGGRCEVDGADSCHLVERSIGGVDAGGSGLEDERRKLGTVQQPADAVG